MFHCLAQFGDIMLAPAVYVVDRLYECLTVCNQVTSQACEQSPNTAQLATLIV